MAVTEKGAIGECTRTLGGVPWMVLWPTIESELRKVVRRRLPPDCDVRDVMQEVCVRMLESPRSPADPGEAVRYATTIACNYVRDLHRRRIRSRVLVEIEDGYQDVERAVLARLRFDALQERVAAMDADDRQAFADPHDDPMLKTGAMRVRRSRIRARVAASIKSSVGGGFAIPRLRWLLAPAAAAMFVAPTFDRSAEDRPADPAPATSAPLLDARPKDSWFEVSTQIRSISEFGTVIAPSPPGLPDSMDGRGSYKPEVVIQGPAGTGGQAGAWEPPAGSPEQPLVCISGVSPSGDLCTPAEVHPRTFERPK